MWQVSSGMPIRSPTRPIPAPALLCLCLTAAPSVSCAQQADPFPCALGKAIANQAKLGDHVSVAVDAELCSPNPQDLMCISTDLSLTTLTERIDVIGDAGIRMSGEAVVHTSGNACIGRYSIQVTML